MFAPGSLSPNTLTISFIEHENLSTDSGTSTVTTTDSSMLYVYHQTKKVDKKDLEDFEDRAVSKASFKEFVERFQKGEKGNLLGLPDFKRFCRYGTANFLRPTPMLC